MKGAKIMDKKHMGGKCQQLVKDGRWWSPDGGWFTSKDNVLCWDDGDITNLNKGGAIRILPQEFSGHNSTILTKDGDHDETTFIKSLQVLKVFAGDIVVIKVPGVLSEKGKKNLIKSIRPVLPSAIEVVVLENGVDIGVVRLCD